MSMSSSKRWAPAAEVSTPARHTARRSVSRSSDPAAASRTLWPSYSSSSSSGDGKNGQTKSPTLTSSMATLADHLAKDDHPAPVPHSLARQRSCTERPRLADAKEARKIGKGGVAFGRSMRLLPSTKPAGVTLTPGRVAPCDLRRLASPSLVLVDDAASTGSECTDASRGSSPRTTVSSKPLLPRTSSARLLGSSATQWALSPGRRTGSSSPLLNTTTTTTLATTTKRSNKTTSLISLGWGHLFNRRKHATTLAAATLLSSTSPRNGAGGGEAGHQVRMAHCRLLQWRFANAREDAARRRKAAGAEVELMGAWASVSEMRAKVARKRVQLEREKLGMKLNAVLPSQLKHLESWEHMETKHASALASTVACARAAVCRLPLTNGAKVSVPSLASTLQHVLQLLITTKITTRPFGPMALETTSAVSELVRVAREEQAVLQDCLELLGQFSALQVEEQSLRCHLVQSSSSLTSVTVE